MTVQRIIALLFRQPIDAAVTKKAQGLAIRSRIEWQAVLDAMTTEQKKAVDDAEA